MSNGGVHILSANAGSMDRILLATDLLYKRIEHIRKVREQAGKCNTAPTLREIEKSHVLFVNAHFKPFASIAQEYERVQAQSGTAAFGSTVQFSIPQYGDFFADIAGRVRINPVECTAVTFDAGSNLTNLIVAPNFPYPGLVADAAPLTYLGGNVNVNYVDKHGNIISPATGAFGVVGGPASVTVRNWVKYCDYPGLRLLRGVRFTVNGNPLDSYTSNVSTFYLNFLIPSDKLDGFKKLIGQEVPIDAFSSVLSTSGSKPLPALGPDSTDTSRRLGHVLDGPQTPKALQPQQVWMIPHWFWFCKDTRLAIASVSIPYGQRFIEWDLEVQNKIQYVVPGTDIFIRQFVPAVAGPTGTPAQTITVPYLVPGSTISTGTNNGAIAETTLFINNLFMQSEVHDIFIDRVGFSLIRLHRFQNVLLNAEYTEVLLNQLKWPIETIYSGVRPSENTADNAGSAVNWYKYGRVTNNQSSVAQAAYDSAVGGPGVVNSNTQLSISDTLFYDTLAPVCSTLKVESHGNTLWQELPVLFYNAYAPFQFGGANVITPKDDGVMMVNFALYPGSYQPSGHLNISRSREFHFDVQSTSIAGVPQISSSLPAELVVYGVAINFLLISDGSAVIRYST